ncbi:MAG: hypothetical protein QM769_07585 [Pseudoxanthomonas sp.]
MNNDIFPLADPGFEEYGHIPKRPALLGSLENRADAADAAK